MSAQERLTILKQTSGVREEDVHDYQKTEVIRAAIKGVKKNASINEAARLNPKLLYSGVKSKVAGNKKSINKS